jgi:hypothetical protein
MATVTYVGGNSAGPTTGTHWNGVQFPLNVPVKVTDKELIAKAKQHPHFTVDGKTPEAAEVPDAPSTDPAPAS